MTMETVVAKAAGGTEDGLKALASYLAFAPISCDPEFAPKLRALADKLVTDLSGAGFSRARILSVEGAHPSVAAEWMNAGPHAPTVLIYGHFDVQPVKGEVWNTPPHELVRKGERVYGRGSADDMGGWLSHLVALRAYLETTKSIPCNIKLLLEGEEEIGSPNLERIMDAFPDAFEADAMVLTDCENPSVEIPGLTISLRGLLELEVSITTATSDVHSGLWGNIAPDPATLLVRALSRVIDEDGRLSVARQTIDPTWLKDSKNVPLDRDTIKLGAHLADGVEPLDDRGLTPAAWGWRQPAITVLSTTFPPPGSEKNAIRKSASAKLSVRIAPGQTAEPLKQEIENAMKRDLPKGVELVVKDLRGSSSSWNYTPMGPAFEAADRAYEKVWGKKLLRIGVGGSIPFVALFGKRFSSLPLILNGVIDPETTAHGPNESMHVGIFEKTIRTNVYLYDELAKALRKA